MLSWKSQVHVRFFSGTYCANCQTLPTTGIYVIDWRRREHLWHPWTFSATQNLLFVSQNKSLFLLYCLFKKKIKKESSLFPVGPWLALSPPATRAPSAGNRVSTTGWPGRRTGSRTPSTLEEGGREDPNIFQRFLLSLNSWGWENHPSLTQVLSPQRRKRRFIFLWGWKKHLQDMPQRTEEEEPQVSQVLMKELPSRVAIMDRKG